MANTTKKNLKAQATKRPAGLTAVASSAAVLIAKRAGVALSPEEAVTFVGGLTAIVSAAFPRCLAWLSKKSPQSDEARQLAHLRASLTDLRRRVRALENPPVAD